MKILKILDEETAETTKSSDSDSDYSDEDSAVVIDLGSHMIKAGFAGDDSPRVSDMSI